jgi:DNA-binding MarR family transcriptional regulator
MTSAPYPTERPPQVDASPRLELDAAALTTLALLHQGLNRTIATSGDLNVTQYRVLLQAFEAPEPARISDLATALNLRPNVVTQAADHLELLKLVKRVRHPGDGRSVALVVTPRGRERIATVDAALTAHLDDVLSPLPPEQAAQFRGAVESSGAGMEQATTTHAAAVTSSYVTGIAEAHRGVKGVLERIARVSFTECRVMLNAAEASNHVRVSDVAAALGLPTSTVTRAVDRLEEKGWAQRTNGQDDWRAVYIGLTEEGLRLLDVLRETLISFGRWRFYRHLSEQQRDVAYYANRALAESLLKAHAESANGSG